ncbi:Endonuclease/exonuclease/phosphatase [Sesbania bispinosa]|nr:Endonuclease/exonuclease/phosphatase [Sesbania bispinosa]
MKILSWNCRGVAATTTSSDVMELCKKFRPAIVFLMETKSNQDRMKSVQRKLKFTGLHCVESRGLSGGLCLLWDDSVDIEVDEANQNVIRADITIKATEDDWSCYFVYVPPNPIQRRSFWSQLGRSHISSLRPWCLIGDFNEMLNNHEKEGLRPCNLQNLHLFQDFVQQMDLLDLDLKGNRYTWFSNPRNGVITREKLDRALVNWAWLAMYPNAISTAYPAISSDHSLILLDINPEETSGQSFKYEAFWDGHQDCKEVVKQAWNQAETQDRGWANFREKSASCSRA